MSNTKQALNAVVDFEKSLLYNTYTVTCWVKVGVRFTPSREFSYSSWYCEYQLELRLCESRKTNFKIMRDEPEGLSLFLCILSHYGIFCK